VRPAPIRYRDLLHRAIAAVAPRRRFLRNGPAGSGSVCLTFDDGPHPDHTPRLLDVLGRCEAVASFFVVGREVARHPGIVRRIAAEGHAIGHHSYFHGAPGRTSARQLIDEVRRTRDLLGGLLGEAPSLFRPPYGRLTAAKLWRLWRAGQTVVLWNVDPKDFARGSPGELLDWFRARPPEGGDVVLMHDNIPLAAAVLPELVAAVRDRGLDFTTVERWSR